MKENKTSLTWTLREGGATVTYIRETDLLQILIVEPGTPFWTRTLPGDHAALLFARPSKSKDRECVGCFITDIRELHGEMPEYTNVPLGEAPPSAYIKRIKERLKSDILSKEAEGYAMLEAIAERVEMTRADTIPPPTPPPPADSTFVN